MINGWNMTTTHWLRRCTLIFFSVKKKIFLSSQGVLWTCEVYWSYHGQFYSVSLVAWLLSCILPYVCDPCLEPDGSQKGIILATWPVCMFNIFNQMRRLLHHHFQSPPIVKHTYDIFTWLIAIMCTDITSFSIMILTLEGTLQHFGWAKSWLFTLTSFYYRYYYYINVIAPLVIIILPIGHKSRRELQQKNQSSDD